MSKADSPMVPTAMVLTVGGSPDAIRAALADAEPQQVLFVVSEGSKSLVEKGILPGFPANPFQWERLLISDHEDIGSSYREIRRGIGEWIERRDIAPAAVAVDITGGTKTMSAALALAGVERFSRFRYVGGDARDSGGLGRVLTGSERIKRFTNPWNKYAIRELERASSLLGDHYADSAAKVLHGAAERCDAFLRSRVGALAHFVDALAAADRFDFKQSVHIYGRCRAKLELILDWDAYQSTQRLFEHWRAVREEVKDHGTTPGRATILELIANACRRAHQGRYDDAVGRLYRVVELHAQGLAKAAFGAELGKVSITSIPINQQAAFRRRFGDGVDGIYKMGIMQLFASVQYSELGSAQNDRKTYELLEAHLQGRNNSLLAHGTVPVKQERYDGFLTALLNQLSVEEDEIPQWPDISVSLRNL